MTWYLIYKTSPNNYFRLYGSGESQHDRFQFEKAHEQEWNFSGLGIKKEDQEVDRKSEAGRKQEEAAGSAKVQVLKNSPQIIQPFN